MGDWGNWERHGHMWGERRVSLNRMHAIVTSHCSVYAAGRKNRDSPLLLQSFTSYTHGCHRTNKGARAHPSRSWLLHPSSLALRPRVSSPSHSRTCVHRAQRHRSQSIISQRKSYTPVPRVCSSKPATVSKRWQCHTTACHKLTLRSGNAHTSRSPRKTTAEGPYPAVGTKTYPASSPLTNAL